MIIVQWQNATKPRQEAAKIERAYAKRLLELCNSEAHARAIHAAHKNSPNPCSQWARLNAVAVIEATAGLPPSERREARFIVRFE